MKKTTKKSSSKAKKTVRNLEVKPTRTGKMRGGATETVGRANFDVFTISKGIDRS